MNKEQLKKDIQAYADNVSDVFIEQDGSILFTRGGNDFVCKCSSDNITGNFQIEFEGKKLSYKEFIGKEIAKLDIFASKLLERRHGVDGFIDGAAITKTSGAKIEGTALNLLKNECQKFLEFGTKITFITADAGHGKTALLKQFQHQQAKRYLDGESNFLFWHVDLQGRDLVRLPEAIMYEVGDLRLQGIYYPSIINLLKNKFIVLAIDGFDELAAEIGGSNAITALSSLVIEMEGQGTLIAASRRAFIDTQDYLGKTKFLQGFETQECSFNEIVIKNWTEKEDVEYLEYHFDEAQNIYSRILKELNNPEHPILTRPFLLTKVAAGIIECGNDPSKFFGKMEKQGEGVNQVVEAFIRREVDKWKERDSLTGNPYLSFDEHIQLLALIAKEMWENQREIMTLEEVQFYTTILTDEWKKNPDVKRSIVEMVQSHAFLVKVSDEKRSYRKFEHEEFRNYFLARALVNVIDQCIQRDSHKELKKILYQNQLPDSVAKYCVDCILDRKKIPKILELFREILVEEWKPTYLQSNIGTLLPYLLNKFKPDQIVQLNLAVTYSSLIFENKELKNLHIENGTFVNISLRDTSFENLEFKKCTFNEIKFDLDSTIKFINVKMDECEIKSIIILQEGEVYESAFAPIRINQILQSFGIKIFDREEKEALHLPDDSQEKKLIKRFLLRFNKTVMQYENNIVDEKYFGQQTKFVLKTIIPFLETHKIIEARETRQTKQSGTKAWILKFSLDEIFKGDDPAVNDAFGKFWKETNSLKEE